MSNIIVVNKLGKTYKKFDAVKEVSFNVQEGEIFGFLGPNGAGKSTTINMLCTMLKPTRGTATIKGNDIINQKDEVRKNIGIIFQENTLDEKLTAYENLVLHSFFYSIPKPERSSRIEEVLTMVELLDKKDNIVETFSGGMKRRLEIARGLLHHPRVLFLDEPTVGLDPQTRAHIWDYIIKLKKKAGITIFLTTHYMDEAEYSDRIGIIDHGELIALESPDSLKEQIGGDIIELTTADNERAKEEIERQYKKQAKEVGGQLSFQVERGSQFLVGFVKDLKVPINSINLRRPTLNDVFLKLTGREIREEEASTRDIMKRRMRSGH